MGSIDKLHEVHDDGTENTGSIDKLHEVHNDGTGASWLLDGVLQKDYVVLTPADGADGDADGELWV